MSLFSGSCCTKELVQSRKDFKSIDQTQYKFCFRLCHDSADFSNLVTREAEQSWEDAIKISLGRQEVEKERNRKIDSQLMLKIVGDQNQKYLGND